ncbi:sulfatase-like hydrolase/transferase [Shewanella alkalitolerans]|uniref:sulfatase-like hydrolase/transferase n=1 Tax=Shewanella alkalitolerans TaxID=2864209 RepID=UPI001C65A7BB|nr:sulfatase-like hydrolase/transferase [Shewanella alkalitolerans]QYJ96297.1 sulfatase-like hydrolase/transferase [Shewanella alkalitolerans]
MPDSAEQITKTTNAVSLRRTFFRTLAMLIFFLVIAINYKQLLQYYSAFSLANAMTHIEAEHLLSKGLMLDLTYFALMILALHVCWALVITLSCRPWFAMFSSNDNVKTQIWLVLLLLHCIWVLSANAYFYPTSLLSFFRGTPLATGIAVTFLGLLLLANIIYALINALTCHKKSLNALILPSLLVFSFVPIYLVTSYTTTPTYSANSTQPNIFIIGIDGLRPDHLAYRGADRSLAPSLNQLLSESLIYDQTYTPQGRTFVAWMGILSGLYPTKNGARFNLAPPELVDKPFPILDLLAANGYQTTYAIDERRFNQIDASYGFDRVIGPKVGAADAIISNLADLPLINLAINFPLLRSLLPYLYINRAYGKTYDPLLFNSEVLHSLSSDKPNFLAVHFCQLHWPFTSKDFIELDKSRWHGNYNHYMYGEMIKKVDMQVADFIANLSQEGLLDNAVVYLLSDHGEGFLLNQDRLAPAGNVAPTDHPEQLAALNVAAWGHGTNVLSQEQSQVVLATLRYRGGKPVNPVGKVEGLFSLIDVAPSIVANLSPTANQAIASKKLIFDGLPLPQDLTRAQSPRADQRYIFVESSLPVRSINTSFIDDKKVMSETASHYEIRDDGRAVMKPESYHNNIQLKQRSVYARHWQLVMLPKDERLILVDTANKRWHNLSEYSGDAPWETMLDSLCQHYHADFIDTPRSECSPSFKQRLIRNNTDNAQYAKGQHTSPLKAGNRLDNN